MKTLTRLTIVLVVALAVVGITYGVSQSTWATQQLGSMPAVGEERGWPDPTAGLADAAATLGVSADALSAALGDMPPDYASAAATLGLDEAEVQVAVEASLPVSFGARPEGAGEERGGHESGLNASTLTTFVRILLPVALMIAGVTLLRSVAGWLRRRQAQAQPMPAR